jgi:hypothetical protein
MGFLLLPRSAHKSGIFTGNVIRSTLPETMATQKMPCGSYPISCGALARKIPNVVFSEETLHLGKCLVKPFSENFLSH